MVREERDLGVILRDDLKMSENCQQACMKANRMLGLMARTIGLRNLDVMTRLYKSLVRPHLEYCVSAWSPHYVRDRELLERVQRRFSRMVPGLRGLGYEKRLERLGLLTLEERRNRADLIELLKISKGMSAISLESFFELDSSGRTRGHSLKLKRRRFNMDTRKFFFSERVVNRWNSLDEDVVSAGSIEVFKERLRRFCEKKKGCLKDHL